MNIVDDPKVFLIASPMLHRDQVRAYLSEITDDEGRSGEAWVERLEETGAWDALPEAGLLAEFMGRLCYKSWVPGLNKNVTKVREDHDEYVRNILGSGHGSVIEHPHFSFAFHNVSRVFTAEMNRHRLANISEQSLRYVRLDDIDFWEPNGLKPETYEEGRNLLAQVEAFISKAYKVELTDDMPFSQKKVITSKLRRWAPLGLATQEGWTANIRTIRHVIEMRTAYHAEEEIRIVADQIAQIMLEQLPAFFGDYEIDVEGADNISGPPAWITDNTKV